MHKTLSDLGFMKWCATLQFMVALLENVRLFLYDTAARFLMQALEEVDKNLVAMKHMLLGEGDAEPNPEQVAQLTVEACKDDFLELLVQKLPTLGWDVCISVLSIVFFSYGSVSSFLYDFSCEGQL